MIERLVLSSSLVEQIVDWRMGSACNKPILDWRGTRMNFDTPALLDSANAGGITLDHEGFHSHRPRRRNKYDPAVRKRFVEAAEDLHNAWLREEAEVSAFAVMNDARLFPSIEYIGPATDAKCVQLSFARTVDPYWRPSTEIILWPLSEQFRRWTIPAFEPKEWKNRDSRLLWRGQATGIGYDLAEEARPLLTGVRQLPRWLNMWLREEVANDDASFDLGAKHYQRLIAVSICRKIEGADVKLVPLWDGDRRSIEVAARHLGPQIISDRIDPGVLMKERLNSKYLLTLPGNDFPSGLRHDLLSGGLLLMPRPFWECIWFYGLQPNVHYIPLRADLADLEERLAWCKENDNQCREIAQAGRAFALKHFDPQLEREVQSALVSRIARQTLPVDCY